VRSVACDAGEQGSGEAASNTGSYRARDGDRRAKGAASGDDASTAIEEGVGRGSQPLVTISYRGSIGSKQCTHDRVDEEARVWAVSENVRGELTLSAGVEVPADVTPGPVLRQRPLPIMRASWTVM
jgi:hypothetical protein